MAYNLYAFVAFSRHAKLLQNVEEIRKKTQVVFSRLSIHHHALKLWDLYSWWSHHPIFLFHKVMPWAPRQELNQRLSEAGKRDENLASSAKGIASLCRILADASDVELRKKVNELCQSSNERLLKVCDNHGYSMAFIPIVLMISLEFSGNQFQHHHSFSLGRILRVFNFTFARPRNIFTLSTDTLTEAMSRRVHILTLAWMGL